MKIGLFIPSFFKYDAMGNDVFMMYKILKELQYDVRIFAQSYDDSIEAKILPVNKSKNFLNDKNNIAIYHHGVYTDFFDNIANAECRKIFRYHNVTYPELFEGYDNHAVDICRKGREQLYGDIKKFDYFLSCSKFNNDELINNYGIDSDKTFILPPFHKVEEWKDIKEDLNFKKIYIDENKINILTVGRLSPNKNHKIMIRAFADYVQNYNTEAVFHIVGKIGPRKYYDEIISLINELHMTNNIHLYSDGIEESKLKTLYKNVDIGLIASKHEGFCVPIVEFMYFGIPIVSSSFTALKDTVGKYGILIDNDDYIEFSVALKYAEKYKNFLGKISEQGFERFRYKKMKEDFINYINDKVVK